MKDKKSNLGNALLFLGGGFTFASFVAEVPFLFLAGVVMMVIGGDKNHKNKRKKLTAQRQGTQVTSFELDDTMIMRLAERMGGQLGVQDLSKQTSLSEEEAKKRLEQLHIQAKCEIDVTEEGKIVYIFE